MSYTSRLPPTRNTYSHSTQHSNESNNTLKKKAANIDIYISEDGMYVSGGCTLTTRPVRMLVMLMRAMSTMPSKPGAITYMM